MLLNPASWQLKSKFIAIVLLILLIPIASIVLLKEIESTLVTSLKQKLSLSAKLYALQLEYNKDWFMESQLPISQNFVASELFVFPLQQLVLVDGFFEEWEFVEKFRAYFNAHGSRKEDDSMALLLGSQDNSFYLSLKVRDDKVIFPDSDEPSYSDRVVIRLIDKNQLSHKLYIAPRAPGKIPVKRVVDEKLKIDWRFFAYWVESENGFNLELKLPTGMKPQQIQVQHFDVDAKKQKDWSQVISSSQFDLNPIVWPSIKINQFIQTAEMTPGQRIWVLDTQGRVLARQGNLNHDLNLNSSLFLSWILTNSNEAIVDTRGNRLTLNMPEITSALSGKHVTRLESNADGKGAVALAVSPISTNGQILGAVLIEENVARVQLLQQKTLAQVLYATLAVFVLIMLIVIWYVSKLVDRIGGLKKAINSVVDEHGRMSAPLQIRYKRGDEIDELSNSFLQMGNRLYDYNDYLEKLASRLSHELRTPIAIVRSSIDNLLLTQRDPEDIETLQRALEGTQRLGEIITRMRQASGVKDAMQNASFEELELNGFIERIIQGFEKAFIDYRFRFEPSATVELRSISPDLLAELMDKLLTNAMEFTDQKEEIVIKLKREKSQLRLVVANKGPLILKKNLKKIFNSLVSIRKQQSNKLNLGLGLYIVNLIAEFHGADAKAKNMNDDSGVEVSVIWRDER